jgi:hypothetical protein
MAPQIFTGQFGGKTVAMPQPDDAKRACEARQLVAPTVLVVLLSGCGSLASRELYPEVRARHISLSPITADRLLARMTRNR